jgi:hypothetical protein
MKSALTFLTLLMYRCLDMDGVVLSDDDDDDSDAAGTGAGADASGYTSDADDTIVCDLGMPNHATPAVYACHPCRIDAEIFCCRI